MKCSRCGHDNPATQKYCGNCGAPLAAAPERPAAGERKLLTILFADVVGSTAMAEKLDPEEITEIMNGTFVLFNAAVARTQGGHADGLVAGTSPLLARSYGVAMVSQNVMSKGDHFSLSLTKPLRVFDGSINMATMTVDEQGYPVAGITKVALHPDGNETDLAAGYARFWGDMNLSGSVNLRQDADNLKGVTDVVFRLGTGVRF